MSKKCQIQKKIICKKIRTHCLNESSHHMLFISLWSTGRKYSDVIWEQMDAIKLWSNLVLKHPSFNQIDYHQSYQVCTSISWNMIGQLKGLK